MALPGISATNYSTWICLLLSFIIEIKGPGSCFVTVRSFSPQSATMGRDPVLLECQYRTTGADLVLGVNWYRRQTYGDDFFLIAQVPNQKFVSLPPTFVDKHLSQRANVSVQTKGDYQSVELVIWPATCQDEGTYQCEVQVYGGRAPARPTMEVNLNEEPSTPSLSQSPSVLVENYPVTFTCRGTVGRPISSFRWYVYRTGHGSAVEEVEMSGISSLDKDAGTCSPLGSSTLAVMITRADQRVKCVLQQNTKKHILKVEDERQLDVHYGVTDTNVRVKLNSRYQNPEEEVQAVEGDTLLLSCNSRGNPEPTFTWSYLPFDGEMHGSHKNGLKYLLDNSDVLITNLTTNHSASYVCVSTNIVRGRKQTETKAVRIVVHERFKAFIGHLQKTHDEKKYVLRYVMIGGIVLGAMLFVILLSLVSVIIYRKCTQMEDRNYLVQYHGVKS